MAAIPEFGGQFRERRTSRTRAAFRQSDVILLASAAARQHGAALAMPWVQAFP